MNKRIFSIGTAVLLLIALLATSGLMVGCAGDAPAAATVTVTKTEAPAAAKPVDFRIAYYQVPTHWWVESGREVFPQIADMSNGRVNPDIYDSAKLGSGGELLKAVDTGAVDFTFWYPGYNSASAPFFSVGDIVFQYSNLKSYLASYQEFMPLMQDELDAQGYSNVMVGPPRGIISSGSMYIGSTDKVLKTPADLQGTKARAVQAILRQYFDAMGIAAATVATPEVYEALERGIIDTTTGYTSNFYVGKWMEPCKYYVNMPLGFSIAVPVFSKSFMDKLSADDRAIIWETVAAVGCLTTLKAQAEEGVRTAGMAANMEGYNPTPAEVELWREPALKVMADWIAVTGERGQMAKDIIDKNNALAK